MNGRQRKQYVEKWKRRNGSTFADMADLLGVSQRTVQSWVDYGKHGRVPSETVVKLLQVHDGEQTGGKDG